MVSIVQTQTDATLGGDSGAPWGDGGNFLGIHFGLVSGYSSFSRTANVSQMNVTLMY